MMEHVVLVKFRPETTKAQKDAVISELLSLKAKIPGILDMHCNYNINPRGQGYEIGLSARFESKEALDVYGPHPEHRKVVDFMHEVGAIDTLVVDFAL